MWGSLRRESYIFTLVSMAEAPEYKTLKGKVQCEVSSAGLSLLALHVAYAVACTLSHVQRVAVLTKACRHFF